MKKKLITWSNITNVVFGILLIVVFVSPQAKAIIIQGLMKVGLFQPDVAAKGKDSGAKAKTDTVPDLILKSSTGKTIDINSQKGKVLFINFWATWCPPCIAEMPSINELYAHFKNNPNILILSVDADNDFSKSVPFMKKNSYDLTVYNSVGGISQDYLGNALPTTVIIDKTGKMVLRHEGGADYTNKEFILYLDDLSKK